MTPGLALVALVVVGCDDFPRFDRIGVSLASDGEAIEIHYVVCGPERVTDIRVEDISGPEDQPNPTLWSISSDQGSDEPVYTVGATPDGFDEVVPLTNRPAEVGDLLAIVTTTLDGTETRSAETSLQFTFEDLNPTEISANFREVFDPDAFRERAERSCQR